ncbi:hypothetical protein LSH36_2372g00007 [Paralvinella palmiformis]|uniref:Uncharacterized protein n=1 Tax=Paralvinella palmiformis TaxID=53620 RepID=A0AAD9MQ41_9ANNE|nr:hypothetical protein LSH36_2372g00007 [Paralvinella palmiformis]
MNPWHNSSHCYGGDMVACSKNGPWKLCFPIRDNSTVKEIIDIFSRYGTVANVSFTSTRGTTMVDIVTVMKIRGQVVMPFPVVTQGCLLVAAANKSPAELTSLQHLISRRQI